MMVAALISLISFAPAQAALPSAQMIFQRVAENHGTGSYTIEQDAQFANGTGTVSVKETWNVDNDQSLRLTATAVHENKEWVRIQILYQNGQRWILKNGRRESSPYPKDFFERLFHLRSPEAAAQTLHQWKVISQPYFIRRPAPRKGSDAHLEGESFVRLARSNGVINWAFGAPSTASQLMPGLWVEQDAFLLRKIRLPSLAEVTADSYAVYARQLNFPKERNVHWGDQTVSIRLLSVNGRSKANTSASLEIPWTMQMPTDQPAAAVIEEFYTRFR